MNRKFRRMGGVKREVDALRSVWACPYYGQLSLILAQVYGNTNGGLVTEGYLGNRLEAA